MNPGYPSYPPYPPQQQPAPGFQSYPPYSTTTSQTPSTMPSPYPAQPGFNSTYAPSYPHTGGYPAQPGSNPTQLAYPPQQGSNPTQLAYPPQQGSNPIQPGYPPTSGYPQQQSAYPPASYGSQPGYPPSSGAAYPGANAPQTNQPFMTSSPSSYPSQGQSFVGTHLTGGQQCQEQLSPTVKPAFPFDPRRDAEILRKAMKGFGTDEQAIINVLTKRSNCQRQEIAAQFKTMYGKDLISDLKSELSGNFENLVLALMMSLPIFLATELRYAMEGIGTNEQILIEILCTASNAEIHAIKNAYQQVYRRSLENDLSSDTSGHFRRLLISVVQGRRSENNIVDDGAAARDAQSLMTAGILKWGTDESVFNAILCTRSYAQLRRILSEYQRLSGHTLEHSIRSEFSGDIQDGLLAIIQCVVDKTGYFAGRLRDAIACFGTKDRQLIRIVVSRSEIDMQRIKQSYQQRYGKSVEQDISNDTSGDYKKALLALVSGY